MSRTGVAACQANWPRGRRNRNRDTRTPVLPVAWPLVWLGGRRAALRGLRPYAVCARAMRIGILVSTTSQTSAGGQYQLRTYRRRVAHVQRPLRLAGFGSAASSVCVAGRNGRLFRTAAVADLDREGS
jgi:hypothetical protein